MALAAALPLSAAPTIDEFFQEFFEAWVKADPEMATAMRTLPADVLGKLDGKLSDIGDEAAHARIGRAKDALKTLTAFDRCGAARNQHGRSATESFRFLVSLSKGAACTLTLSSSRMA